MSFAVAPCLPPLGRIRASPRRASLRHTGRAITRAVLSFTSQKCRAESDPGPGPALTVSAVMYRRRKKKSQNVDTDKVGVFLFLAPLPLTQCYGSIVMHPPRPLPSAAVVEDGLALAKKKREENADCSVAASRTSLFNLSDLCSETERVKRSEYVTWLSAASNNQDNTRL